MEIEVDKDEVEFNYRVATIIACDVAKDYAQGLATIYQEQGKKYERNKTLQAAVACEKAMDTISRDLKSLMPHFKPYIEKNMGIIYDVIGLPVEKQEMVAEYLKTLKE